MTTASSELVERVSARTARRQSLSSWGAIGLGLVGFAFVAYAPHLRMSGPSEGKVIFQIFVGVLSLLFIGLGAFMLHEGKKIRHVARTVLGSPQDVTWYYDHLTELAVSGVPTGARVARVCVGLRDGTRVLMATADDKEAFLAFLKETAPSAQSGYSKELEARFKSEPSSLLSA